MRCPPNSEVTPRRYPYQEYPNGAVVLLRCIRFRQDMICNDIHAPHQEIFVHDPVKQL